MNHKAMILSCLSLIVLGIYLFVQAPPPLPDKSVSTERSIDVRQLMHIVANENNAVRSLYTKEIVTAGKNSGLAFSEDWLQPEVEAGPLPALFLRESSKHLEKDPVPLSLFLGSDYPISQANAFSDIQLDNFKKLKSTLQPQFFYAEDIQRFVGMYPDYAVADACVNCHNEHKDSPKKDWKLGDLMGATTWLYSEKKVPLSKAIAIVSALRSAFKNAYAAYVDKARNFTRPPEIADKWPKDGYFLPSVEVFMHEYQNRSSGQSLELLIDALNRPQTLSNDKSK